MLMSIWPAPVSGPWPTTWRGRWWATTGLVERLLIAYLTGGHVLLEGPPGIAKTRAVKQLAARLPGEHARIQCTPDLLPSDLTGSQVFRPETGGFDFLPGPVFHNIVLVDEINRAPPKVQSALLEAMAEGQVTTGGVTRPLPHPFMVVATQNPDRGTKGPFRCPRRRWTAFCCTCGWTCRAPRTNAPSWTWSRPRAGAAWQPCCRR